MNVFYSHATYITIGLRRTGFQATCRPTFRGFQRRVVPSAQAAHHSTSPSPVTTVVPPPALFHKICELGVAKVSTPPPRFFVLSVLAGFYIALAGFLTLSVGHSCPHLALTNPGLQRFITGAIGLPFGLTLVTLCGGELFTGSVGILSSALLDGRIHLREYVSSLSLCLLGNIIGCLFVVFLIAQSGLMANSDVPIQICVELCTLPWVQVMIRALGCSWLVCLAIFQITSANSVTDKVLGIFLPISTAPSLGFIHPIAICFTGPFAIVRDAPITWLEFLCNALVPSILGNLLAGFFLVALPYAFVYGKLGASAATPAVDVGKSPELAK